MAGHRDGFLIAVCIVAGLALISVHGHHHLGFGAGASASGRTVSVSFMAHMIQLQFRQVIAAVGTVITIR